MFCRGTICSIVNCLSDAAGFPYVQYIAPCSDTCPPPQTNPSRATNASLLFAFLLGLFPKKHISLPFPLAEREARGRHFACGTAEGDGLGSGKGSGRPWGGQQLSQPPVNLHPGRQTLPCFRVAPRCQLNAVAKLTDLRQVSASGAFLYFSNNDEFSDCVYVYLWASLCMCIYICIMYTNI